MKEVLERITPSEKERKEMEDTCAKLLRVIGDEASRVDERTEALLLGSISRDTWLSHEKDIDIFLRFPEDYSKSELEEMVTRIGKKILENTEKRYAEHPYIKGGFAGHMVEIVPCYHIKDATKLKCAVDRTPFHDEFVRRSLGNRRNEVRLLKQFLPLLESSLTSIAEFAEGRSKKRGLLESFLAAPEMVRRWRRTR